MPLRTKFRWLFTGVLFLTGAIIWSVLLTSPVSAQCDTPPKSSCLSCHEQVDHLDGMGEWNKVHLSQDMCTSCHGGNGTELEKGPAHKGVTAQPLSDIYTNCHSCHPIDYKGKSSQFAAMLQVTTGSCATPTPIPANVISSGLPPSTHAISQPIGKIATSNYPMVIIGWLVSLFVFGLGLAWLSQHQAEG